MVPLSPIFCDKHFKISMIRIKSSYYQKYFNTLTRLVEYFPQDFDSLTLKTNIIVCDIGNDIDSHYERDAINT